MNNYKKILITTVCLMSFACSGPQTIPSDKFYRLNISGPETAGEYLINGKLSVAKFSADALHSERALVYTRSDMNLALNQYHYHYWIDAPTSMIQHELAIFLKKSKIAPLIFTSDITSDYDYQLKGNILRFERIADTNEVDIEIEVNFIRKDTGDLLLSKRYRETIKAGDNELTTTVHYMGIGVTSIFNEIVRDISNTCNITRKCS